jgi:hypothetical protein
LKRLLCGFTEAAEAAIDARAGPGNMRESEYREKRAIVMVDGNTRLGQAAKRMRISRPTLYEPWEAHAMAPLRMPAAEEE